MDRQRLGIRLSEHEARLREFEAKARDPVTTHRTELDAAIEDYERAIDEFRTRVSELSPSDRELPRDAAARFSTQCDDLTSLARRVLRALY